MLPPIRCFSCNNLIPEDIEKIPTNFFCCRRMMKGYQKSTTDQLVNTFKIEIEAIKNDKFIEMKMLNDNSNVKRTFFL